MISLQFPLKYSFHPTIGPPVATTLKMWLVRWRPNSVVWWWCIGAFRSPQGSRRNLAFSRRWSEKLWENRLCLAIVNHSRMYCCEAIKRLQAPYNQRLPGQQGQKIHFAPPCLSSRVVSQVVFCFLNTCVFVCFRSKRGQFRSTRSVGLCQRHQRTDCTGVQSA